MSHAYLYFAATGHQHTLSVLIAHPTEDRRLSWPKWLMYPQMVRCLSAYWAHCRLASMMCAVPLPVQSAVSVDLRRRWFCYILCKMLLTPDKLMMAVVSRCYIVIAALSSLLSQLSIPSANSSKLSDDLSCLLAGLVPDSVSSNSSTLHSTAAELLSST